jgi:hypothetical protein
MIAIMSRLPKLRGSVSHEIDLRSTNGGVGGDVGKTPLVGIPVLDDVALTDTSIGKIDRRSVRASDHMCKIALRCVLELSELNGQ